MKFLLRIGVQTMTNSKDIRRITPEEIEQQKQYCREIRKHFEGRPGGPPLAYTQTYGCPLV